jgi:hypothetical protein
LPFPHTAASGFQEHGFHNKTADCKDARTSSEPGQKLLMMSHFKGISVQRGLVRLMSSRFAYSSGSESIPDSHVDIFEGIKDTIEKKSGYKEWLAEINQKMAEQSVGPFYLGGTIPFPHNPEFKPHSPITDTLRDRLYQLHAADPKNWTPRKLSALFKVAIPRIKAILKLKQEEAKRISDGKLVVNADYVKKMETMLNSKEPVMVEPEVTQEHLISNRLRPHLVAIPENSELTPADAAKILGLKLLTSKSEEKVNSTIQEMSTSKKNGVFIKFDPYEKSRSPFIFVDISSNISPKTRQVLVRQPNGDLRTGTSQERLRVARRVWGKSANRFIG